MTLDFRDADGDARADAQAYGGYTEWKRWDGAFRASEKESRYFAAEFAGIELAGRRVLEIGFGNGAFMAWAREQGADVAGIELNADMREAAHRNGFEAIDLSLDALAARGARYDVIVAFDVLEHWHTEELVRNVRCIRDLLRDGGVFLARFPNGQSPFGRAYQHGDFTHKSTLTTYKIEYLATIAGLAIRRIANACRVASRPGLLGTLRQWWLARRRRRIERTISRLYGIRRLPLDPNLVVVLQRADAESPKNEPNTMDTP